MADDSLTNNREKSLQTRLEEVLDGMPVAVSWASLEDQQILFLNKKFTQMFGYVPGDHLTVSDWIEQTYINPDHVERAQQMWYPHFGTTSIRPVEIEQVEVDVLCKDGTIKTTLLSGVILPQEGWALAAFVDITDRKQQELKIQKLALEDPLTALANRRAFTEMLQGSLARAIRSKHSIALLLADLDHFKPLNDTFGHDHGDMVLQTVAERLKQAVRAGDVVCRLGGDEFSIILGEIENINSVEEIAERILEEIRKPYAVDDVQIQLSVSLGIGLFPKDADDAESLYKKADEALYQAKDAGRGRWCR